MKKTGAIFLIVLGALLVIISILSLVSAFDTFTKLGTELYNTGYVLGSVIFPLLMTVVGRWVYRRGKELWRANDREKV